MGCGGREVRTKRRLAGFLASLTDAHAGGLGPRGAPNPPQPDATGLPGARRLDLISMLFENDSH